MKKIFCTLLGLSLVFVVTTSAGATTTASTSLSSTSSASTTIASLLSQLESLSSQLDSKMQELERKVKCYESESLTKAEIKACKKEFKGFTYSGSSKQDSNGNNSSSDGKSSGSKSSGKSDLGLSGIMKQLDQLFGNGKSGSGLNSLLGQGGSGSCSSGSGACGGANGNTDGTLGGMVSNLLGLNSTAAFGGKPTEVIKCNCNEDKPAVAGVANAVNPNNTGLSIYLSLGDKALIFDKNTSIGPAAPGKPFDTAKIVKTNNVFGSYDSAKTAECKYSDEGQVKGDKTGCDQQEKVKTKTAPSIIRFNIGSDLPVLYTGPSWCGDCKALEGKIGPYAGQYRTVIVPQSGVAGVSAYPTLRVAGRGDVVGSDNIAAYLQSVKGR